MSSVMKRWPYVVVTALVSGAVAVWAIPHLDDDPSTSVTYRGNDVGPALPSLTLDTVVDPMAAQVMLLAAGVALLVQIYSTAYMGDDKRYRSYASLIVLFLIAMVAVVATDNLFVLLIGWEVMGVCSYLLIGHAWELPQARAGAAKAFIVTRVADIGLLVAIIVLGQTYGTYRISHADRRRRPGGAAQRHGDRAAADPRGGRQVGPGAAAHLAAGRDARPDADHRAHPRRHHGRGRRLPPRAAAAGVRDVAGRDDDARRGGRGDDAARRAVRGRADRPQAGPRVVDGQPARPDVRRAVRRRLPDAGITHLVSHGAFKALLFLGCGVAMQAVGSSALSAMGGLRTSLPVTFWTMTIGFAALAGIVPTVGFFSKDGVLDALHVATDGDAALGGGTAWVVLVVAVLTSGVTALYATRLWAATFLGAGPRAR